MHPARAMLLTRFVATAPHYTTDQQTTLDWLVAAHAQAEAAATELDFAERALFGARVARAIRRCACGPEHIARRGHSFPFEHQQLQGTADRTRTFAAIVDDYFTSTYENERDAPDELVHVTCTGYVSPSGAQKLVAARGWGGTTRVTHAYQMGCYAAVPALRIASGALATGARRVDIAHTELCSLHVDPRDHSLEQLVVQSLFADGLVRYSATSSGAGGLRVRALHERLVPGTADAMTWTVGDAGMQMTLARDVPELIGSALRAFVLELLARAGCHASALKNSVVAVHPGGPRIIDLVRDVLELAEPQVADSRAVLRDHGNMSSATLPHIWMRVLADERVAPGTLIASLAFGPGLTLCGAILEKR